MERPHLNRDSTGALGRLEIRNFKSNRRARRGVRLQTHALL
jgi:hypothetical protein